MNLDGIRTDLHALQGHEVVLFGSTVAGTATPRSDIDVAVITRGHDREHNKATWWKVLGQAPDRYDIRVFELLPLPIQIDIADHHQVVFGDRLDLSEYFYRYRRLWKDQRHRIEGNRFATLSEKRAALRRARRA